jgi:hypothetical protein
MKSKNLLLAKALISIVLAFFMLFLATTLLNVFLKNPLPAQLPEPAASIVGLVKLGFGYFGAMLVGIAAICFFASSAAESALRRKVILSLFIADAIGFVIALIAQFSGKFTALGWLLVLLWLALALLLGYFYFLKPVD